MTHHNPTSYHHQLPLSHLSWWCVPALNDNYIWVLRDEKTPLTLVVDPATADDVINFLQQKGWSLDGILNTHHHYDHVGGNEDLIRRYGASVYGSKRDRKRIPAITHPLEDGARWRLGNFDFEMREVDGHTLGHICYFEKKSSWLFVGDTLFSLGCGRFFEGTPQQMQNSLNLIKTYPKKSLVFCGHEYTLANARFALSLEPENQDLKIFYKNVSKKRQQNLPTLPTVLSTEKALNPFLRTHQSTFVKNLKLNPSTPDYEVLGYLRKKKDHFSKS